MALVDELVHDLSFRPKCYITLETSPVTITPEMIRNGTVGTTLSNPANTFTVLGAVQSLTITSERSADVWRELNYNTAGKPIESYPGLPTYEVSLERVVLYESNLLEAFGFAGFDIMRQNKPLTIRITMKDPKDLQQSTTDTTSSRTKVWYVYGVWFRSNPMEFDVTDDSDIRIIQEVDAVASGIVAAAEQNQTAEETA